MSTRSTASSSTDRPSPEDDAELGRRGFFRAFGRQTVQAAGSLAGAVDSLRRSSAEAAGELLDLGIRDPRATAERLRARDATATDGERPAGEGFRAPYRVEDDVLYLLDQRALPGTVPDVECRTAADVAGAMRNRVIRGAPVLAQVAAYGIALTAARAVEGPEHRRLSRLRTQGAALRAARPSVRPVRWSVRRMLARLEEIGATWTRQAVAMALRDEADAICNEQTMAHAALGRHGADVLPRVEGRPLSILLHGNAGALGGGLIGTALGVVTAAVNEGRSVQAFVTETRPTLEGSRLTAWELAHAGIPTTVLADGAVAWLLERQRIDALLIGAEWVAANGDTANVVGSRTAAALCFRHRIPVYVCAPLITIDPETPDGASIPEEHAPADTLLRLPSGVWPPHLNAAFTPVNDVVPAALITAFVTEAGVLRPPYDAALTEALRQAAAQASSGTPSAGES